MTHLLIAKTPPDALSRFCQSWSFLRCNKKVTRQQYKMNDVVNECISISGDYVLIQSIGVISMLWIISRAFANTAIVPILLVKFKASLGHPCCSSNMAFHSMQDLHIAHCSFLVVSFCSLYDTSLFRSDQVKTASGVLWRSCHW